MTTSKQVIVIRKDLNMRKGKIAAQAAHASLAVFTNKAKLKTKKKNGDRIISFKVDTDAELDWFQHSFTKICVYVNSEEELIQVHEEAKKKGILTSLIKDSGTTEFNDVPTYTAVAVGPDASDKIDLITGYLPLY